MLTAQVTVIFIFGDAEGRINSFPWPLARRRESLWGFRVHKTATSPNGAAPLGSRKEQKHGQR